MVRSESRILKIDKGSPSVSRCAYRTLIYMIGTYSKIHNKYGMQRTFNEVFEDMKQI